MALSNEQDFTFLVLDAFSIDRNLSTAIRLTGVTEEGSSVSCTIHGFHHYFYASRPSTCKYDGTTLKTNLNYHYENGGSEPSNKRRKLTEQIIHSVTVVKSENIRYYKPNITENEQIFYKISLSAPNYIKEAKEAARAVLGPLVEFFEDNVVKHTTRFMVDREVPSGTFITLPAKQWTLIDGEDKKRKLTNCKHEVILHMGSDFEVHRAEDDPRWSDLSPIKVFSFDIECRSTTGQFPVPAKDPVVQIAIMVQQFGEITRRIGMSLGGVAPLDDKSVEVLCYDTEEELLEGFRELFLEIQPQIITGYNVAMFDIPYLIDRAEALRVRDFAKIGLLKDKPVYLKRSKSGSRQKGTREKCTIYGLNAVIVDMLDVVRDEKKFSSYTLNYVSQRLLGSEKEDVHHSLIPRLSQESDRTRKRLLVYCLKDSLLPLQLFNKLEVMVRYVEIARLCYISLDDALHRGQQIRVSMKLLHDSKKGDFNYVIPFSHAKPFKGGYTGGLVLEPKSGYYGPDQPVSVMDFNSLYPNTERSWNLSYDTLLLDHEKHLVPEGSYTTSAEGHHFMKAEYRQGILPAILTQLLDARAVAKKEMKQWKAKAKKEPQSEKEKSICLFRASVQNGRQLALKIIANSCYGYTGFSSGYLPELAICEATTSYGRMCLQMVANYIEENYGMTVVYGDTDSVMVLSGHKTVPEALDWMDKAEEEINSKLFAGTNQHLAKEKVLCPVIFLNAKKRYCGGYWTKPNEMDMVYSTGLENVRRDNCELVHTVLDGVMENLFQCKDGKPHSDIGAAKKVVVDAVRSLYLNETDFDQLVITKGFTKPLSEYKNMQWHIELVKKMIKRDPGSAPRVGDRVSYVIVPTKTAEDPIYALQNAIAVDTDYYIQNQIEGPVKRVLSHVIGNQGVNKLFYGSHTVKRVIPSLKERQKSAPKNSMLNFVKVKRRCKVCARNTIPNKKEDPVCDECEEGGKLNAYLEDRAERMKAAEEAYDEVYKYCQNCQGTSDEVVCMARDCPILYKRTKRRITVEHLKKEGMSW